MCSAICFLLLGSSLTSLKTGCRVSLGSLLFYTRAFWRLVNIKPLFSKLAGYVNTTFPSWKIFSARIKFNQKLTSPNLYKRIFNDGKYLDGFYFAHIEYNPFKNTSTTCNPSLPRFLRKTHALFPGSFESILR